MAYNGNVNALRDMNNMVIERRSPSSSRCSSPSTSNFEPLDFRLSPSQSSPPSKSNLDPLDFQASWSSKLAKYDLISVITDINDDIHSLTFSDDTEEDDSSDVAMIPEAKVTFATPLVSAVHTIPRLTSEQIRILYYSRAERLFFKKQYRLEKMMAQQEDPAAAYQTLMGMN